MIEVEADGVNEVEQGVDGWMEGDDGANKRVEGEKTECLNKIKYS